MPGHSVLQVLLIEPTPADADRTRQELTAAGGFVLTHVTSLAAAVAHLAAGRAPDAALLALDLPDSRGLAALERLRGLLPWLPVVVLAGAADDALGVLAVQAGAQDYLVKGRYGAGELTRTVRHSVERHRLRRKLVEAERTFRLLVEKVHDHAIFLIDHNGIVTTWSAGAERQLGYAAEEVIGTSHVRFFPPEDQAAGTPRRLREAALEHEHISEEGWRVRKDGTRYWANGSLTAVRAEDGTAMGIGVVLRDLSDRRASELALRRFADTQVAILNSLPAHIAVLDGDGTIIAVNEAWRRFGLRNALRSEELGIGANYLDICDRARGPGSEDALAAARGIRDVLTGAQADYGLEYPCHSAQEQRWFRLMVTPVQGAAVPRGAVVMHVDITERKLAELQRLRLVHDPNERVKELTGLHAAAVLLGQDQLDLAEMLARFVELVPATMQYPEVAAAEATYGELVAATPRFAATPWQLEAGFATADGTRGRVRVVYLEERPAEFEGPFLAEERRLVDSLAQMLRASFERRQAAARERELTRWFQELADNIQEVFYNEDLVAGRILYVSPSYEAVWGQSRDRLYANADSYIEAVHPADRARVRASVDRVRAGEAIDLEYRIVRPDGDVRWVRDRAYPVRDEGGRVVRMVGVARDITDGRNAVERLRVSEERFRLLARATSDAIWDWDPLHDIAWWSEGFEALFGHRAEEMVPPLQAWLDLIHPEDRAAVRDSFQRVVQSGDVWSHEYRFRRKDGEYAHVLDRGHVIRDDAGRPVRMIGAMTDLTARKQLEAQLLQSQKLEAIGRLAGGVAHDFNNLLTVINGYSEILMTLLPAEDDRRAMLAQIHDAGTRAANLTRQLLAFSRKQMLTPRVIDLNVVVAGLEKLLARLIGEHIQLTTVLQPQLARICVDPGQLEQVIVNLAVNARDAMPQGGRLTIETAGVTFRPEDLAGNPEIRPGDYVALIVSDTGCGMAPEVRERIFEPFYTTKVQGKGTGLGLATVFGIVKQSGGAIEVSSQVGAGTRFRILLPVAVSDPPAADPRPGGPAGSGSETVLLVEDEPGVRGMTRQALEAQGYRVLAAADGAEALALWDRYRAAIRLVVTDVIMPEMSGVQLVERLRQRDPALRALYITGYTDDALLNHGAARATDGLLHKPFTPQAVAQMVRDILDRR